METPLSPCHPPASGAERAPPSVLVLVVVVVGVSVSQHGAVPLLLCLAVGVLQRDAAAVLRAALDLAGQPGGPRLPLPERLAAAALQRNAVQREEEGGVEVDSSGG